jgi:hypothetical protein
LRKIISQHQEIRFKKISRNIEKDILKVIYLKDKEFSLKFADKYTSHPKALVNSLINYIETFQGNEIEHIQLIFDHALKTKLRKKIYSRNTTRRLRAVRPFVLFSSADDIPHILKLLHDKPVIKLATINALSLIPKEKTLSQIFQAFEEDPEPNKSAYMNVFFGLGARVEHLIKQYLNKPLSIRKIALLIELTGAIPLPKLYLHIIHFSDHQEKEIRIKTARTLGSLNIPLPAVINTLGQLVSDSEWEVRAQALKSLGKLKSLSVLAILEKSVFSPFWYCRLNAGLALSNLGYEGIQSLKKIARQQKDIYASDMAQMVLADMVYF